MCFALSDIAQCVGSEHAVRELSNIGQADYSFQHAFFVHTENPGYFLQAHEFRCVSQVITWSATHYIARHERLERLVTGFPTCEYADCNIAVGNSPDRHPGCIANRQEPDSGIAH